MAIFFNLLRRQTVSRTASWLVAAKRTTAGFSHWLLRRSPARSFAEIVGDIFDMLFQALRLKKCMIHHPGKPFRTGILDSAFWLFLLAASATLLFLIFQLFTRDLSVQGQILPQAIFTGSICLVFLGASVFGVLKKESAQKLEVLLLLFSLVFALFAFEFMLTFLAILRANALEAQIAQIKASGQSFDDRTPLEAIADLGGAGKNITPLLTPLSFAKKPLELNGKSIIPVSGIPSSKVCACNEGGVYKYYEHDRFGFNNPDSAWDRKEYDIVTVGDSFTYGICVDPKENFAGIMGQHGLSVLNLGFPDRGPLMNLAAMQEYLGDKKMKTLIWFHYEGNDFGDLSQELQNPIASKYFQHPEFSQELRKQSAELKGLILKRLESELSSYSKPTGLKKLSHSFQMVGGWKEFLRLHLLRMTFLRLFHEPRLRPDLAAMEKIILQADAIAKSSGAKFLFVYLPSYSGLAMPLDGPKFVYSGSSFSDLNAERKIIEILQRDGVATVDMGSVLRDSGKPLEYFPFQKPGHYNPSGYRAIGESLAKGLK